MISNHGWMTVAALLAATLAGCAEPGQDGDVAAAPAGSATRRLDAKGDLTVEARGVTLARPMVAMREGRPFAASRVVEFVVTAPDPIPARALDPVLVVGARLVREYRYEKANRLVFVELEPEKLPARAPVSLQWGTAPAEGETAATGFVFDAAQLAAVKR